MSINRTQSRLVRKEHKQLVKQTVWSVIIGLALILAFVFWVLPNSVRFLGLLLDTGITEQTDQIPPQVPVISLLEKSTNQTPFTVKGFGEPESQIIFVLNGDRLEPVVVGEESTFEASLPLTEGDNIFIAFSMDKAENESKETKTYQVVLDTELPTLTLDNIFDGQQVVGRDNQQLAIRGLTDPQARVYINDRPILADFEGAFSSTYRLDEGDNQLLLKVVDRAGNEGQMELTIKFKL
ncbi:MAG: hypothetical protein ABIJ33_00970 [Patescibacteria group bacterium]|nr:hypothetical protein [Patescibacteria group bacterium]